MKKPQGTNGTLKPKKLENDLYKELRERQIQAALRKKEGGKKILGKTRKSFAETIKRVSEEE